jgi:hypothetical protein
MLQSLFYCDDSLLVYVKSLNFRKRTELTGMSQFPITRGNIKGAPFGVSFEC